MLNFKTRMVVKKTKIAILSILKQCYQLLVGNDEKIENILPVSHGQAIGVLRGKLGIIAVGRLPLRRFRKLPFVLRCNRCDLLDISHRNAANHRASPSVALGHRKIRRCILGGIPARCHTIDKAAQEAFGDQHDHRNQKKHASHLQKAGIWAEGLLGKAKQKHR